MRSKLTAVFVGILLAAMSVNFVGCGKGYVFGDITERNPVLVKTSVQIATIEFLKYNPKHTDRLIEICTEVKVGVEAGTLVTVKLTQEAVRSLINFDNLVPAERVLVDNLIEAIGIEADRWVTMSVSDTETSGTLSLKTQKTLVVVLQWIIDSANLMKTA